MKGAGFFGTGFLSGLAVGSALTAGALYLLRGTAELALETDPELEPDTAEAEHAARSRRGHKAGKTSSTKHAKGHGVGHGAKHDDVSRRN